MTVITSTAQIARISINNEPSSKREMESNKQLRGRDGKQGQSFQQLLEKKDSKHQPIARKDEGQSGNGNQSNGQGNGNSSESISSGVVGNTGRPVPTISGTSGSDVLFGTSGKDVIDGKGGNDLIFGGQGNDVLLGGTGNDLLLGGRGNDILSGGTGSDLLMGGKGSDNLFGGEGKDSLFGGIGDDFLSGGRGDDLLAGGNGNDKLYGGSGNDTFTDESGNNHIDGGQGSDTFRLGGNIDAYHISVNDQGDFEIQELTKRFDSPHHTVKNIESFQFADITISASDLKGRIENPVKDLPLTESQTKAVGAVFNISNASVQDNDSDGKISEGDTVSGNTIRQTTRRDVSFEISKDNADHINGALGPRLQLSPERLEKVDKVVNQPFAPPHDVPFPLPAQASASGVLDSDGSGSLSVGDVVYSRPIRITIGGDPAGGSPVYHRLTENDIQQINSSPVEPLELTKDQDSTIRERFDIGIGSSYRVLDSDGNDKLGVGDQLEINIGGDAISIIELNEADVEAINNSSERKELELTKSQQQNISEHFNKGTTRFTGVVIDKDSSGSLSVGDVAKLTIGGFAGNIEIDHVLTAQDIEEINDNSSSKELELTKHQQNNISKYFREQDKGYLFTGTVIDKDASGTLSEGDIA